MLTRKRIFLIVILWVFTFPVFSQHQTSSPYSSYGIGQVRHDGLATNLASGYTGIALSPKNNINPVNPASYTAFPEKNFTLEAGLKYNMSRFKSAGQSQDKYNLNIDYLSFGFPITDWWGVAVGLIPYSSVGYNITNEQSNYTTQYEGSGGINQVFFGTAVELFNHLSLGVNGSYLFGKTDESIVTTFDPDYSNSILMREDASVIDGLNLNAGLQGNFQFNNFGVTLGVTYKNKRSLNASHDVTTVQILNINDKNFQDTISTGKGFNGTMTLPAEYGIGIAVDFEDIRLTADYTRQDWTETDFYKKTAANFANQETYKFGGEIKPDAYSTQYLKIIHYRFGGYYRNTYLQLPVGDGKYKQLKSYGLTAGLFLPVPNTGTMFNLGFDLGTFGTTADNLLAENYLTINFGFVFKDIWFRKRKFN